MVAMAAIVMSMQALVYYSFGVFLLPIIEEFSWERGVLSGAVSVASFMSGAGAIYSGRLSDKYGLRILITANGLLTTAGFLTMSAMSNLWHVYLGWGVIIGIGGACCFTPVLSTIPRWFVKKRGIATGLAVTGFGLGAVFSPPIAQWLISSYGWRQAYIVLAVVTFAVVVPVAQLMRHSPQRMGLKPYGEEDIAGKEPSHSIEGMSFREAIRTRRFWLFGLILAFFFLYLQVITVHIVPHAVDVGIQPALAATILSVIAGSSVIGRLSMGFVSDRIGSRKALTLCLVLAMLALVWLLFTDKAWGLYLFAAIFGLAYGGIIPLQPILSAELYGLTSLGIILGSLMLVGTVGGAVGAPLAGSIYDVTGSYRWAIIICIVISVLAFIVSLGLLRSKGVEAKTAPVQASKP
jgi:MFS family permease